MNFREIKKNYVLRVIAMRLIEHQASVNPECSGEDSSPALFY